MGTTADGVRGADGGAASEQDRQAAVAALDAHRAAGRLDPVGFEERSVRAGRAGTREELRMLFLDLPEPHPVFGVPAWGVTPAAPQPPAPLPPPLPAPSGLSIAPEVARRLIALTPFVALVLFFTTHNWLVFLLIPVVGILLGRDRRRR